MGEEGREKRRGAHVRAALRHMAAQRRAALCDGREHRRARAGSRLVLDAEGVADRHGGVAENLLGELNHVRAVRVRLRSGHRTDTGRTRDGQYGWLEGERLYMLLCAFRGEWREASGAGAFVRGCRAW